MFRPREREEERFISIGEARAILEISEREIEDLVARGDLPAYKIGDEVLRFRKDQVSELKASWRIRRNPFPARAGVRWNAPSGPGDRVRSAFPDHLAERDALEDSPTERMRDFWYFNDFYIISIAIIIVLMLFIVGTD